MGHISDFPLHFSVWPHICRKKSKLDFGKDIRDLQREPLRNKIDVKVLLRASREAQLVKNLPAV